MNQVRKVISEDGRFDEEIKELIYALNALPGIETSESCFGHGKEPARIWFKLRETPRNVGLFFLTRCIDRRYSTGKWDIKLSVGDMMWGDVLPTNFILESKVKGVYALAAISDLLTNLNSHANHKNFLEGYKIDLSEFSLADN